MYHMNQIHHFPKASASNSTLWQIQNILLSFEYILLPFDIQDTCCLEHLTMPPIALKNTAMLDGLGLFCDRLRIVIDMNSTVVCKVNRFDKP